MFCSLAAFVACDLPTEDGPEPFTGGIRLANFDDAGRPLVRFDVDGNPLDAHGGQINLFGDTYYLYGETYACGFQWLRQEPVPFCGFRVYSSPNLVDWEDRGLLFDVADWVPWQSRCHWWTLGCFRPHIAYNAATRKYVLWVNVYADPVNYYVLESDSPIGPFVERGTPTLAFNMNAPHGAANNGDHNLFVDDDGTGYLIYTEWRQFDGDQIIERLTPDYLNGTGEFVRVATSRSESPSMFKRNGRYYLTASTPPNGGYATSVTSYFTARSPLGPWSKPIRISPNSCGGQPFHVSALPSETGEPWYLYQSDLWLGKKNGKAPGDRNQAPAALYWEPLRFNERGDILPIACEKSFNVPAKTMKAPSPNSELWHLSCDIGTPQLAGYRYREIRFTAGRTGRLREATINLYQRDEPTAPLQIDVRTVAADTGTVLHRAALQPNVDWWIPPVIAWTASEVSVPLDVAVTAGSTYAIRLHAELTQGCYGLAVRDDLPVATPHVFVSENSGRSWSLQPQRNVRYQLSYEEQ